MITILDGAMGTELRARGVNVRDYKSSLWSALACVEAPDAVTGLHRDYIDAGADIITVNNYAVTPLLLARENLGDQRTTTPKALALTRSESIELWLLITLLVRVLAIA